MPLMAASVGLSATARIALPRRVKRRKANSATHRNGGDRQVLELLRADAQSAEAPVAHDRQVVVAQRVAEAEPHQVLQRDGQRDRGDRRGDQPACGAAAAAPNVSLATPTRPATRNASTADGTSGSPSQTLAQ